MHNGRINSWHIHGEGDSVIKDVLKSFGDKKINIHISTGNTSFNATEKDEIIVGVGILFIGRKLDGGEIIHQCINMNKVEYIEIKERDE